MVQFKLRIPDDLHAKLVARAAESDRTITSEILARLERSLHEEVLEAIVERAVAKALKDS